MAAKEIKTLLDLLRWYHNTPKQIPGCEIDYCLSLGWKLGQAAAMKEMEKKFTGAQQLKAEIADLINQVFTYNGSGTCIVPTYIIQRLRQLSAV